MKSSKAKVETDCGSLNVRRMTSINSEGLPNKGFAAYTEKSFLKRCPRVPGPGEREGEKMAGLLLSHLAPIPGRFLEVTLR